MIGIEQIDGDYSDFAGAAPNFGIHIPNSSDATKIMYLTPRIAGFQAGASYTPESDNEAQAVVPLKNTSQYKDFAEFGANYTGEFGALGVQLGATLTTAEGQPADGRRVGQGLHRVERRRAAHFRRVRARRRLCRCRRLQSPDRGRHRQ